MNRPPCEVVLVEPEPGVARALCGALEGRGHRVRSASDTAQALELPDPDVLVALLDERMGLDLLRETTRRGRLAHAVLLAGDGTSSLVERAFELGALDVLRRPVELAELLRAVDAAATARPGELALELAADPRSVEASARHVLSFAMRHGVGPTARARLASATAEIVDNSVRHAYPSGAGTIDVFLRIDEREASVRVRDRGRGYDARGRRSSIAGARARGIERAAALSESIELWSEEGRGSTTLLRFGIYRVAFDGGPLLDLMELDYFSPQTAREVLGMLEHDPVRSELALSPALAVLVGRLLSAAPARSGPPARRVER